ncbi:MAG: hypothetical protein ACERKN_04380 [Velocimicrobium sp.]
MGVCTGIILIYIVVLFALRGHKENYGREKLVIKCLHLEKWLKRDKQDIRIRKLYPSENWKEKSLELWYQKIHRMAVVFGIVLILGVLRELSMLVQDTSLVDKSFLTRPNYGEGANTVMLEVSNNQIGTEKISLDIEEKTYSDAEREVAFAAAKEYIKSVYLRDNESKEAITTALFLPQKVPKSSITIDWVLDEEGIFLEDGSINEGKREEAIEVKIQAILTYQEWKEECVYSLKILPAIKTQNEQFWEKWKAEVLILQKNTRMEPYLSLPKEVDGESLFYEESKPTKSFQYLLLAIIASILAMEQMEQKLKNDEKKREEDLLLDYPCLVNKFVLLLGAGMTIGGAFEKITGEYNKEKQKKGMKVKYVYEEMLITQKEILNGVSEVRAYEQFGKRIKRLEYLKFSTLLSQNLRKGSNRMLELLEIEAIEAFEMRKEYAKKKGEEAGTRLLVPMILMLMLVMGIIIMPAFLSF